MRSTPTAALRFLGALLLVGMASLPVDAQPAGAKDELPKLHVLIISDTEAAGASSLGLGRQGERVADTLREAFKSGAKDRSGQLNIRSLTGKQVTPENILTAIAQLPIKTDDALLVFYSGHGAIDKEQKERGLVLTLHNKRVLLRSDILATIDGRSVKLDGAPGRPSVTVDGLEVKPRLVVVLTDCCAEFKSRLLPERTVKVPVKQVIGKEDPPPPPPPLWPLCESLFMRQRGRVVGTACEDGKPAFALTTQRPNAPKGVTDPYGLMFGDSFLTLFKSPRGTGGIVSDKVAEELASVDFTKVTWQKFAGWVGEETNAYAKLSNETQRPQFTELKASPWLGVGGVTPKPPAPAGTPAGPIITKVVPESLAAKAGFKNGDVITKIGTTQVGDWEAFVEAVREAKGKVTVEVFTYDVASRSFSRATRVIELP